MTGNAADPRSDAEVTPRLPVTLRHISKTYPGSTAPAVDDLSLDIAEGEVFTLLGPSGSGKTTTLRIVAGLENPDQGSIHFDGRPIVVTSRRVNVPPNKRNVGMVFQSYAIWPHMTVAENVGYPLKVRRLPRAEIRERVARALDMVGLAGLEDRPAPNLSGGQQQRVALARALVYEPSLFLFDEPFSNLDSKLREQMRIELKLLQKRLKATILFVTHDQVEALSLSDRIAIMNLGRVHQLGPPRELYEHPVDPFVRDFLGKTTLLTGVVRSSTLEGRIAVLIDGSPDCLVFGMSSAPGDLTEGTPVTVAMRPEDVELTAGPFRNGHQNVVPGVIETVLFEGDRNEYRIKVPAQNPTVIHGQRKQVFRDGEEILLRLTPETVAIWAR